MSRFKRIKNTSTKKSSVSIDEKIASLNQELEKTGMLSEVMTTSNVYSTSTYVPHKNVLKVMYQIQVTQVVMVLPKVLQVLELQVMLLHILLLRIYSILGQTILFFKHLVVIMFLYHLVLLNMVAQVLLLIMELLRVEISSGQFQVVILQEEQDLHHIMLISTIHTYKLINIVLDIIQTR